MAAAGAGVAVIHVIDDGPGIPEAALPLVFERFVRADDARSHSAAQSTGLGLAIVRELIGQQGGAVTLADAVEGGDPPGLAVRVWFPSAGS